MKGKDEQLLLADICARLPYGVKFASFSESMKNHSEPTTLRQIYYNRDYNASNIEGDDNDNISTIIALMRPYLRPLSSMTDEEKNELDLIIDKCNKKVFTCPKEERKYNFFDMEQVHFYLSHHFDINELILKNLAIEAPEGLYKI